MKTFTLNANITFSAEDFNYAFVRLAKHFATLRPIQPSDLNFTGNIHIGKVQIDDQISDAIKEVGPEFAAEVERFFFDLSAKQEALGDPFADVLRDNAWDLYETDQK
jgi:methenyltetrahydromethanopterin cyclohydrolase